MGTSVPRALISTLLIAGVFYAPFARPVYADETATSTPAVVTGSVASSTTATSSSQVTDIATATTNIQATFVTPESASSTVTTEVATSTPLPTGVLYDNSYADEDWNVQVYGRGHYVYLFKGYDTLGNPPIIGNNYWVTTGTTTYARLKVSGNTTCNDLRYNSYTSGLTIFTPTYNSYDTNPWYTRQVGDSYCEFAFTGEGIPAGTAISMIVFGLGPAGTLSGSHANSGISTTGTYDEPVTGGFAFQLCGINGCAGGFGSSTPVATTTASTTPPGPQVSNVLFLPGIEQSRLYGIASGCSNLSEECEESLWNPLNGDTKPNALLLDVNGHSINKKIFTKTGDVISSATVAGIRTDFYTSFFSDLDTAVGHDNWVPVSYDWRLSLDDLLSNGVQYGNYVNYGEASSTPYIEQTLRRLASSSPTGKVTIVAHSNGGLVAKALLLKLGNSESSRLVDKVILVATPQAGAPQTIGGLLYGYGSALPFDSCANWVLINNVCGTIVSRAEVRSLASTSPMTYHLLPSQAYTNSVNDPSHSLFSFSGTHEFQSEIGAYGHTIDTWQELSDFLSAREGGRFSPPASEANLPGVANSNLLSYAQKIHSTLDAWTPLSEISVYQIAGWGDMTVSGISWYEELRHADPIPVYKKQYRPIFVEDGDNVVPVPSALLIPKSENVFNYWTNFVPANGLRRLLHLPLHGHGDILELPDVRNLLKAVLTNQEAPTSQSVTTTQPASLLKQQDRLVFILHSPVKLRVVDNEGNETGTLSNGNISEGIVDSYFGTFGEVQYVIVPAEKSYVINLTGQDTGTFSLDIYGIGNGTTSKVTTLASVPTTRDTQGTIRVAQDGTIEPLYIDLDGNGSTDVTLTARYGEVTNYQPISSDKTNSNGGNKTIHTPRNLLSTRIEIETIPAANNKHIERSNLNIVIQKHNVEPFAITAAKPEQPGEKRLTAGVLNSVDANLIMQIAKFFWEHLYKIFAFFSAILKS